MLETDQAPIIKPKTIYLSDYRPTDYLIPTVSLEFVLSDQKASIRAYLSVQRNGQHDRPLILDGEKLSLVSVRVADKKLNSDEFVVDDSSLTIHNVPAEFELIIDTEMVPKLNTELSGLYQSSGNFCTQCEAEGFRRITYFLDRPDVLSVYRVRLSASQTDCPVLLSNGNLETQGVNNDGTHWAQWFDPHPKPSYLFALVAGDLEHISDQFTTTSGRQVQLNIYAQAHNIDKCQHAMDSLKNAMTWDQEVYGREYDLDVFNVVAVDDFNMGAMENKGLNIFNSKYVLANQQTATDTDYEGIESVIGHEYFHNWSGNRVTCRDWFQLSLKEGFTVFRDQEFSADQGSRTVKRIRDVQVLRSHQFKEDAGPMAHPVRPTSYQEINNFYTVTIYEKGAEVIRMMHRLVGAAGFRKGTDLYFDRFDGQAVTTEDFVHCMEQANQIDLSQFRLWYTQAGTPEVSVEQHFSQGRLSLRLRQHCPATPGQKTKLPFQIPITIALFSQSGDKLKEQTLVLDDAQHEYHFDDLEQAPLVSVLRDFSAPVKLSFKQSDAELALLAAIDDNGFARWEALQRLIITLLIPAIESGEFNDNAYQRVLECARSLLGNHHDDPAMIAEMLSLPAASYLGELMTVIEPQATSKTRTELQAKLGQDLEKEFLETYHANSVNQFSLDALSMAKRALKNTALRYLVATQQPQYYQLAQTQYQQANNMTDRLAAFTCLVHSAYADSQLIIDDFYQAWKGNALVLDKWFAIQATAQHDNVLNSVKALLQHPAFDISNPNKVRSLIGAFASNQLGFHRQDGSGYAFMAEQIIVLNKLNPQIAARLAGVFNSHRKYAVPFSSHMLTQLKTINTHGDLSSDVQEIVGKALNSD